MSLYRVKQFIWAIGSFLKKTDDNYIKIYLDNDEFELFSRLARNEKHHCIRVCKDAIKMTKEEKLAIDIKLIGKLALLHDLGKIQYSLNVFEKAIIVVLDKLTKGKISKYNNIKHINIYYNHPKIGAQMLKEFNYNKDFIDAIKYHHNIEVNLNNNLLNVLRICDDRN